MVDINLLTVFRFHWIFESSGTVIIFNVSALICGKSHTLQLLKPVKTLVLIKIRNYHISYVSKCLQLTGPQHVGYCTEA